MGFPLVALQFDFLFDPALLPLILVVAGIGLSLAEALAPGAHFIVLGVALLAAGLVGLLLGPFFAGPIVLALLVFLFGALALYGYRELDIYGGKGMQQTSDSDSLKGKTGRVTTRVTETEGEIKLDSGGFNPYYAARTLHGEIPEGAEVMVIDPGGGNVVTVERLDGIEEDEIDRELRRGRERREREARNGSEVEEADREEETERA
ncbi:Membrane protein implicated in regulation of membrane protease activity [Halogranum gelatinilyticum]|uniref:Membrane protein implicated in regulation of membrane protease activity n=1 Tax=Halogranum gelatinilyticum TaxID=660521 RepID=A0A1G9QG40_9EURY|nr:NfeD family protein [Halogranum gelatinilyticum]SDM09275.1 Membrane protein implicated in regulation of membrane protease activity [Halogranum gelatinilyticum]